MPTEILRHVELDDPRLAPFVNVRHTNVTRYSGYFVAEGRLVVERLVDSDYNVHAVLLEEGHQPPWLDRLGPQTSVIALPRPSLEQLVGFNFHRGIMATGERKPLAKIDTWQPMRSSAGTPPVALAPIGVTEPENLGSMLRTAAALGIQDILLGPGTADPFSRRVLRVSMAASLKHRFYDMSGPLEIVQRYQASDDVQFLATTLDTDATPVDQWIGSNRPVVVMMGNEAHGLSPELQNAASKRVTIPMQLGTDSLNVAVAAALFMYEFTQRKSPRHS